jgi:anti-sigma B factor antagonist
MNFNLSTEKNESILSIGGELDIVSAPDLRPVVGKISEARPSKVVVDLSHLRLIDSSGVGLIVSLFKTVRSYEGALAVVGVHDQPLAILRLLQLDRVLIPETAKTCD